MTFEQILKQRLGGQRQPADGIKCECKINRSRSHKQDTVTVGEFSSFVCNAKTMMDLRIAEAVVQGEDGAAPISVR